MSANYRAHDVIREDRSDGTILLRSGASLGPVAKRTTDWLDTWASETPDAIFIAERSGEGWREVTYRDARKTARELAGGLLSLGLGPQTPILILSGNSVDHALLTLAAQYVGIPTVPLAEQYAAIPEARHRIDIVARLVRPGAVYVEDGDALSDALDREALAGAIRIVSRGQIESAHGLSVLMQANADISEAHRKVGPGTVAKILLTSGSTSEPKGVPTTHRMMCVNQAQSAHAFPFLANRPPILVDWLPWNHVFGGSHNFNLALANGGALYIDDGRPTPALFPRTLENLRHKTGTLAFNVPIGYAMLRDALRTDATLRERYFPNLDMLFYAGASLPDDVWSDLDSMAREVRGTPLLMTSSWGMTETAPAHLMQHEPTQRAGVVGVPLPEAEAKLIPTEDDRFELRVKGPNVFTGYLCAPEVTADAFDADGYFITGDAVRFVDPEDASKGLCFDGRLSESFKLLTGTWVRAAALRLSVLEALGDLAVDAIVVGADRSDIGLFLFPANKLRGEANAVDHSGALAITNVIPVLRDRLTALGGSSSTRVARAMILAEPPSFADGEVTAKGNINTRRLLRRRAALINRLYDDTDPATILIAKAEG